MPLNRDGKRMGDAVRPMINAVCNKGAHSGRTLVSWTIVKDIDVDTY